MTVLYVILISAIATVVYLTFRYSFLIPPKKGLAILMYHKVSDNVCDALTVNTDQLNQQFGYIRAKGYRCLSFAELKQLYDAGQPIPAKSVIITFDDAYLNNKSYLLPLLEKHQLKASIFSPLAHLGTNNVWDGGSEPLMDIETVKQVGSLSFIELGIHSYAHQNYKHLSPEEIDEDLRLCDNWLEQHELKTVKVLAYPYGGTHRKKPESNAKVKQILARHGYWFGLRIGNRINRSFNNIYELFRIDIKGTDSFAEFKIKLKKGRTKLF